MLRLAVIRPGTAVPLYETAIARSVGFHVAIVVGEDAISDAMIAKSEDQLVHHIDQFDACVVHANVDLTHMDTWIAAGKHILLDSPTHDLATLDQLADKCRNSDVRLTVSQPRRFTPYATAIREGLDAGHLGQPGLVRIHRWDRITSEASLQSQLWQMFVHELDLACWLYAAAPDTVFGQAIESEGQANGMLGHFGFAGGMAVLDCAFHAGDAYYAASVIGSRGAAYADDHHNTNLMFKGQTQALCVTSEDDWWRHQLESFSQSIQSEANDQTVADTQRAIVACQAAIESAAANRVAKRIGDRYELQ